MTDAPIVILLIEDSDLYAELATYLLESLGYAVTHTFSAREGLEQARGRAPDLILMDMNLRGMGGLDAIRLFRDDPRTQHVPVIALTAEPWSEESDRAATRAGFDAYLSKPTDAKAFETAIHRVL